METENILLRNRDGTNIIISEGDLLYKTNIESVDNLNEQIVQYIKEETSKFIIKKPVHKVITSEDITIVFFGAMIFRRCTVFVAYQTSSRGNRFLSYISTKIKHSSAAFGTSHENVNNYEIIEFINKTIDLYKYDFKGNVASIFGL